MDKRSGFYQSLQEFVSSHELLFNTSFWLNNYKPENIVQCAIFNKNNDIIGCFVYYTFKKAMFRFVICPPYTPHIDLYYLNPAESVVSRNTFNKEISNLLATWFDSLKADYKNLNLPSTILDTQPFTWKGYTSRNRFSYIIDLSKSTEELHANLSSEKRKSLNKASKDNLEIKETSDFETVYSLITKSLSRSDLLRNKEIIKNILFRFANPRTAYAFVALHNGVPLGVSFCIIYKQTALYIFGGFDSENKHHGAGVSCMWQSILKAKSLGLHYFDFEGSMNESIERYFREFGGELVNYACVEKITPAMQAVLKLKGKRLV